MKNALSVLAGFVTWTVLFLVGNQIAFRLAPGRFDADGVTTDSTVLGLTLASTVLYSLIAGAVTARLAAANPRGHALALGALVVAACDLRIGADGPFKIGTNEVGIGMALPRFGVELARDRLSKRHFTAAVQWARIYDPAGAAEAGWLDTVVAADQVEAEALAAATRAADTLHRGAFAATRANTRSAVAAAMLEGLELDLAEFR